MYKSSFTVLASVLAIFAKMWFSLKFFVMSKALPGKHCIRTGLVSLSVVHVAQSDLVIHFHCLFIHLINTGIIPKSLPMLLTEPVLCKAAVEDNCF